MFKSLISASKDGRHRSISVDDAKSDTNTVAYTLTSELIDNGLLSLIRQKQPLMTSSKLPLPDQDFVDTLPKIKAQLTTRDVSRFIISCIIARWRLTATGIEKTVQAVQRRNLLSNSTNSMDLEKARSLVQTYNALKFLIPFESKCLYDSLCLLEFLATYNYFPRWVFAVQFSPWGAHCWVQHGTVAFNQNAEGARAFLPIMVV